jgi:hypothetical protein
MKRRVAFRGFLSWVVLGVVLAAAGACSSAAPYPGGQGGNTTIVGTGGGGGVTTITGAGGGGGIASPPQVDAATDVAVATGSPDADPPLPSGLVAESPPEVSCTGQADAAVECDLPMSTCALPSGCDADVNVCMSGSTWIVYYENPRCVAGRCVWDQAYFHCDGISYCTRGACMAVLGTT